MAPDRLAVKTEPRFYLWNIEKLPSLRFRQASSKQGPQLRVQRQNNFTCKDTHTHTRMCTCTCLPLTSPSALNRELFPQPFGPHTRTLVPDLTCREDRKRCELGLQGPAEGRLELTSKLSSLIRTSPLGVASGV